MQINRLPVVHFNHVEFIFVQSCQNLCIYLSRIDVYIMRTYRRTQTYSKRTTIYMYWTYLLHYSEYAIQTERIATHISPIYTARIAYTVFIFTLEKNMYICMYDLSFYRYVCILVFILSFWLLQCIERKKERAKKTLTEKNEESKNYIRTTETIWHTLIHTFKK